MAGESPLSSGRPEGGGEELPKPGAAPDARWQMLIDAFTKLAAEKGYDQVTADDVAAAASLPPSAFYEYFDGTRQCLAAAYDTFFDRLADQASVACAGEESWSFGVKAAVAAVLEFLRETASRARLFLVEAVAGGVPLYERKLALTSRLAAMLEHGRAGNPAVAEMPASTEWILVGGVLDRVSEHLLAEEPSAIVALEPEVVELVLTPFVGRDEARRVARG